jgi:hypothetical protein
VLQVRRHHCLVRAIGAWCEQVLAHDVEHPPPSFGVLLKRNSVEYDKSGVNEPAHRVQRPGSAESLQRRESPPTREEGSRSQGRLLLGPQR